MYKVKKLAGAIALLAVSFATQAAVSYNVDGITGKLDGIDNLVVDSKTYNVSFIDGSFTSVFGTQTDFTNSSSAEHAATALLNALISPSALPLGVSSTIGLVNGCGENQYNECDIFTTWGPYGNTDIYGNIQIELWDTYLFLSHGVGWETATSNIITPVDTTGIPWSVFAKFTQVSAVPVPATIWLFGSALAGLVGFVRRK
jgi:hypothetical protein